MTIWKAGCKIEQLLLSNFTGNFDIQTVTELEKI